jgi:hypothetical protein
MEASARKRASKTVCMTVVGGWVDRMEGVAEKAVGRERRERASMLSCCWRTRRARGLYSGSLPSHTIAQGPELTGATGKACNGRQKASRGAPHTAVRGDKWRTPRGPNGAMYIVAARARSCDGRHAHCRRARTRIKGEKRATRSRARRHAAPRFSVFVCVHESVPDF